MRPYTLLNRRAGGWELVGRYHGLGEAADAAERVGKWGGWQWWGPTSIAKKMLADSSYVEPKKKRIRKPKATTERETP